MYLTPEIAFVLSLGDIWYSVLYVALGRDCVDKAIDAALHHGNDPKRNSSRPNVCS